MSSTEKYSHYSCAPRRSGMDCSIMARALFEEQATPCNKTKRVRWCWACLVHAALTRLLLHIGWKDKTNKADRQQHHVHCAVHVFRNQQRTVQKMAPLPKQDGNWTSTLFERFSFFVVSLLLEIKWATIKNEVIWLMITYYCHGNNSPISEKRPLLWCIRHQSSSLSKIDLSSVVPPHLWASCEEEK